jgi:hypothetical protein
MDIGAENADEIRQFEEILPSTISAALTHPVLFSVTNDNNVARFLSELLVHLQIVDRKSYLIPKPDSALGEFQLRHIEQKPDNVTNKQFVASFVAGLTATSTQMKGKVWIRSKAKFSTFKKNSQFKEWLNGSKTSPKIRMDRTSLPGTNRYDVGVFLNTVTRFDCVQDFAATYSRLIQSQSNGFAIPEFEIDIQYLYRKTEGSDGAMIRLYRMLASSKADVIDLNELMSVVIKEPSHEISFIPFSIWTLLPASNKDEYFDMQYHFANTYDALKLRGIKDLSMTITEVIQVGTSQISRTITILAWIKGFKANNGQNLFYKVLPCIHNDVEIWYDIRNRQECLAWIKSALVQVARKSGINPETDFDRFAAMFVDPDKVWRETSANFLGTSLQEKRKTFMDFSPSTTAIGFRNTQSSGSVRPPRDTPKRGQHKGGTMNLVFDYEERPENSSSSSRTPARS